jgi:hypothetical protein
MSSLYEDDEDGSSTLPFLNPTNFKVPPFDQSLTRDCDTRLVIAACEAMGCESITISQARRWAGIERNRVRNAHYAERARAKKKNNTK